MTETETTQPFGAAVTPPHQPQPLTVTTYGEEARPVYGEESHLAFGEGTFRTTGEGLAPYSIEGETSYRSPTATAGGRTSAFIVGEEREEQYQCDICGKEFDSEQELTRHVKRIGIVE